MMHDGRRATVVDPGDASVVLAALRQHQLELGAILVTHRHHDHVGGLQTLRPHLRGLVYGPAQSEIPGIDVRVGEGLYLTLHGARVDVWGTPGHTAEHVSYVVRPDPARGRQATLLFCGDTLFSAGCGRVFDPQVQDRYSDSVNRFGQLPGNTQVCCAHEYTLSNLRFARAVEPDNPAIAVYEQRCQHLREQGLPTLPSTLDTERDINPFMRCDQPTVMASARQQGALADTPQAVFLALRQWKNHFS